MTDEHDTTATNLRFLLSLERVVEVSVREKQTPSETDRYEALAVEMDGTTLVARGWGRSVEDAACRLRDDAIRTLESDLARAKGEVDKIPGRKGEP